MGRPEGVDVDPAPAGKPGIDRKPFRTALSQQVQEYALDTVFTEIGMLPEGDDIAKQSRVVDPGPLIVDDNRGPVGLTGYRTVGFQ